MDLPLRVLGPLPPFCYGDFPTRITTPPLWLVLTYPPTRCLPPTTPALVYAFPSVMPAVNTLQPPHTPLTQFFGFGLVCSYIVLVGVTFDLLHHTLTLYHYPITTLGLC